MFNLLSTLTDLDDIRTSDGFVGFLPIFEGLQKCIGYSDLDLNGTHFFYTVFIFIKKWLFLRKKSHMIFGTVGEGKG